MRLGETLGPASASPGKFRANTSLLKHWLKGIFRVISCAVTETFCKGRGQAGATTALSNLSSSTHPQHPAGKRSPSQPTSPAAHPCELQPSPASLPGTEQQPAALLPAGSGVPSSSAPTPGDGPKPGCRSDISLLAIPAGDPPARAVWGRGTHPQGCSGILGQPWGTPASQLPASSAPVPAPSSHPSPREAPHLATGPRGSSTAPSHRVDTGIRLLQIKQRLSKVFSGAEPCLRSLGKARMRCLAVWKGLGWVSWHVFIGCGNQQVFCMHYVLT